MGPGSTGGSRLQPAAGGAELTHFQRSGLPVRRRGGRSFRWEIIMALARFDAADEAIRFLKARPAARRQGGKATSLETKLVGQ